MRASASEPGGGDRSVEARGRRWLTDPRASVVSLAIVLVAAVVLRNAILVALAMGGLAGFSLSGSP